MPSTTAPPTSGPSATARPLMPPQAPSARPRRSAGTAALRMVSVNGSTIAPPSPCTARAAIRISIEGASAAAAEASVKIPRPATKILRRPNLSPSAAPVISRTANTSVYALTVHSSPPRLAWSSLRITGSADVTTRLSRVVMKTATDVMANVQIVVLRVFIVPPQLVVITHLLLREKNALPLLHGRVQEPLGPGRRVGEQIHRREDVQQHPEREEVADALRVGARDALDVVDEGTETLPHRLAHV